MTTLYEKVCDDILGQLRDGQLKVGDRLPPEDEYAVALGVSRSTLRLAFKELEASGVLKRRKRSGTEIIADRPQKQFRMATNGIGDLLSLGRDTQFRVSGTRYVSTDEIPELNGYNSETGFWLEVTGTRTLVGEQRPFSVNRVYVPARFVGIEPLLRSGATSVFRTIETAFNVEVGRVTQTVRAALCGCEEAGQLGLVSGGPVLRIDARLFLRSGELMEISVATFDPERFQVHTDVQIA